MKNSIRKNKLELIFHFCHSLLLCHTAPPKGWLLYVLTQNAGNVKLFLCFGSRRKQSYTYRLTIPLK